MSTRIQPIRRNAGTGQQYLAGQETDTRASVLVPCFSTGVWFAHPQPPVISFLQDLLQRLNEVPQQWDQAAANEVGEERGGEMC